MNKKYYRIIIQNRLAGDRYISNSIFTVNEIKGQEKHILRHEHLERNPDDRLLYIDMLDEIVENMEILGYEEVNLILL